MCSLCRLPAAKNHNFGEFWYSGAPVPTPFDRWGPNLVCVSRHTVYAYMPYFVWIGLFSHPLSAKNPLPFFGLRHLVLSPIGNSLTKLNTGAQLQTFPYPMASKLLLWSFCCDVTAILACILRWLFLVSDLQSNFFLFPILIQVLVCGPRSVIISLFLNT